MSSTLNRDHSLLIFLPLACRKRRIKCGEERPVCQNCIKSKRQCEGYNQRVVFKDPLNAYRPSVSTASHMSFPGSISNAPSSRHGQSFSHTTSGQKATPIAPKPSGTFRPNSNTFDSTSMSVPAISSPGLDRRVYGFSEGVASTLDQCLPPPTPSIQDHYKKPQIDTRIQPQKSGSRKKSAAAEQISHYDFDSLIQSGIKQASVSPALVSPLGRSDRSGPQSKSSLPITNYELPRKLSAPADFYHSSANSTWGSPTEGTISSNPLTLSTSSTANNSSPPLENADRNGKFELSASSHEKPSASHRELTNIGIHATQGAWNISQPWPLDQHQLEAMEEEDPFDVSDEDVEMGETNESGVWQEAAHDDHLKNNDLGFVVALQANQDSHGVSLRSFTSFIDRPDMLATYVPSSQSTPLRDPMTARIFCHFVNVTGPCISMFERHPANPSLIFQGEPVPKTQQHMWTCKPEQNLRG